MKSPHRQRHECGCLNAGTPPLAVFLLPDLARCWSSPHLSDTQVAGDMLCAPCSYSQSQSQSQSQGRWRKDRHVSLVGGA